MNLLVLFCFFGAVFSVPFKKSSVIENEEDIKTSIGLGDLVGNLEGQASFPMNKNLGIFGSGPNWMNGGKIGFSVIKNVDGNSEELEPSGLEKDGKFFITVKKDGSVDSIMDEHSHEFHKVIRSKTGEIRSLDNGENHVITVKKDVVQNDGASEVSDQIKKKNSGRADVSSEADGSGITVTLSKDFLSTGGAEKNTGSNSSDILITIHKVISGRESQVGASGSGDLSETVDKEVSRNSETKKEDGIIVVDNAVKDVKDGVDVNNKINVSVTLHNEAVNNKTDLNGVVDVVDHGQEGISFDRVFTGAGSTAGNSGLTGTGGDVHGTSESNKSNFVWNKVVSGNNGVTRPVGENGESNHFWTFNKVIPGGFIANGGVAGSVGLGGNGESGTGGQFWNFDKIFSGTGNVAGNNGVAGYVGNGGNGGHLWSFEKVIPNGSAGVSGSGNVFGTNSGSASGDRPVTVNKVISGTGNVGNGGLTGSVGMGGTNGVGGSSSGGHLWTLHKVVTGTGNIAGTGEVGGSVGIAGNGGVGGSVGLGSSGAVKGSGEQFLTFDKINSGIGHLFGNVGIGGTGSHGGVIESMDTSGLSENESSKPSVTTDKNRLSTHSLIGNGVVVGSGQIPTTIGTNGQEPSETIDKNVSGTMVVNPGVAGASNEFNTIGVSGIGGSETNDSSHTIDKDISGSVNIVGTPVATENGVVEGGNKFSTIGIGNSGLTGTFGGVHGTSESNKGNFVWNKVVSGTNGVTGPVGESGESNHFWTFNKVIPGGFIANGGVAGSGMSGNSGTFGSVPGSGTGGQFWNFDKIFSGTGNIAGNKGVAESVGNGGNGGHFWSFEKVIPNGSGGVSGSGNVFGINSGSASGDLSATVNKVISGTGNVVGNGGLTGSVGTSGAFGGMGASGTGGQFWNFDKVISSTGNVLAGNGGVTGSVGLGGSVGVGGSGAGGQLWSLDKKIPNGGVIGSGGIYGINGSGDQSVTVNKVISGTSNLVGNGAVTGTVGLNGIGGFGGAGGHAWNMDKVVTGTSNFAGNGVVQGTVGLGGAGGIGGSSSGGHLWNYDKVITGTENIAGNGVISGSVGVGGSGSIGGSSTDGHSWSFGTGKPSVSESGSVEFETGTLHGNGDQSVNIDKDVLSTDTHAGVGGSITDVGSGDLVTVTTEKVLSGSTNVVGVGTVIESEKLGSSTEISTVDISESGSGSNLGEINNVTESVEQDSGVEIGTVGISNSESGGHLPQFDTVTESEEHSNQAVLGNLSEDLSITTDKKITETGGFGGSSSGGHLWTLDKIVTGNIAGTGGVGESIGIAGSRPDDVSIVNNGAGNKVGVSGSGVVDKLSVTFDKNQPGASITEAGLLYASNNADVSNVDHLFWNPSLGSGSSSGSGVFHPFTANKVISSAGTTRPVVSGLSKFPGELFGGYSTGNHFWDIGKITPVIGSVFGSGGVSTGGHFGIEGGFGSGIHGSGSLTIDKDFFGSGSIGNEGLDSNGGLFGIGNGFGTGGIHGSGSITIDHNLFGSGNIGNGLFGSDYRPNRFGISDNLEQNVQKPELVFGNYGFYNKHVSRPSENIFEQQPYYYANKENFEGFFSPNYHNDFIKNINKETGASSIYGIPYNTDYYSVKDFSNTKPIEKVYNGVFGYYPIYKPEIYKFNESPNIKYETSKLPFTPVKKHEITQQEYPKCSITELLKIFPYLYPQILDRFKYPTSLNMDYAYPVY